MIPLSTTLLSLASQPLPRSLLPPSTHSPTPPGFLGFGWEMYQFMEETDAGHTRDAGVRNAARPLAPGLLRVGGITADWVAYDFSESDSGTKGKTAPRAPRPR